MVQKGICQVHGSRGPGAGFRIKAVVDDGTGRSMAVMKKDVTELLTGMTLKSGMEEAERR